MKKTVLVTAALLVSAAFSALAADTPAAQSQKYVNDGVSVEFLPGGTAVEGKDVDLRFWVRSSDGTGLETARPAAWIDARSGKESAGGNSCRQKIQSFLSGSLGARPQVDLNTFYILSLNAEPSISVIDPILGFGGSKLLTAVTLRSPGTDWVLSKDQKRLFVAMPLVNQVAVIDTASWTVVTNLDAGSKPSSMVLSPDGGSVWVADQNDDAKGRSVTVIDVGAMKVAATLRTGRAPHRVAFSPDQRLAVVTNGAEGNVALVDPMSFAVRSTLATGPSPAAVTASSLSAAMYVADGQDGGIAVIDPAKERISARIAGKAGASSIRFSPDGRWGFVTLPKANAVEILDSSNGAIISTMNVGRMPDQVTFTDTYAYVRCAKAEDVTIVRLASLGAGEKPNVVTFPGGQLAPATAEVEAAADAVISAPDPAAVLVANPADRLIYYYMEGMAAPMGNYKTYGGSPKAALIVDRSLKQTEPGVFSIRTRVPAAGLYDVAFFLDSPRVVQCFSMNVLADPQAAHPAVKEVKVEPIVATNAIRPGEPFDLKFKLSDKTTGKPEAGLRDVRVLTFLAPGVWQKRELAEPSADGVYHVTAKVPQPGIYYVFLECPSLGLKLNALRPVILQATETKEIQ